MKHFEPKELVTQMIEVIIGLLIFVALYPTLSEAVSNFTGLGVTGGALITIVPIVIVVYFIYGVIKKSGGLK